jgi:lactate dehydrogenase-like 2-hydroxyacid dehydrogenase
MKKMLSYQCPGYATDYVAEVGFGFALNLMRKVCFAEGKLKSKSKHGKSMHQKSSFPL